MPSETTSAGQIAFFFGDDDRPLFGVFHAPAAMGDGAAGAGGTTAVAAVLCNPFGLEAMCLHRTYRHLAERLASRGVPTLRFDYDGTGNSAGRLDEPDRVRGWVASTRAAIAEARRFAPEHRIVLFGARLGAAIAASAALGDGDVDGIVAWAPVLSGAAYARELSAMRALTAPKAPRRADGSEDAGGYLLSAATRAEIAAMDLLALGRGGPPPARRALVIPGDVPDEATRLGNEWRARGARVESGPRTRYARMLGDPYDTVVPEATLDAIAEWTAERAPPAAGEPITRKAVVGPNGLAGATAKAGVARETPLVFGDGSRLFGILTEPESDASSSRPVVCFLNVGANHHVGPHRMWVTISRELAARGYASLRLDVAGLGESRTSPGFPENRIYAPEFVADVQAAMTEVSKRRGSQGFVLVGLCSGAYLAFHAAAADRRVVGLVLLNTHVFEWKEGDPVKPTPSGRYYAKSLRDPGVWRRALTGRVHARYIAAALLKALRPEIEATQRFVRRAARLGAAGSRRDPSSDVRGTFEALSRRGVESLVMFSSIDGGLDMLAKYLGRSARKMRRRPHFKLEVLEGVEHVFTPPEQQVVLCDLLARYLSQHFP